MVVRRLEWLSFLLLADTEGVDVIARSEFGKPGDVLAYIWCKSGSSGV